MRLTATLGALFLALVALLGGLAFWAAAVAMVVLPVLERSPIRFMPKEGIFGFLFVLVAVLAGAVLLVGAYEVVRWVMDKAFMREGLPDRQAPPALQVIKGGKPAPPPA